MSKGQYTLSERVAIITGGAKGIGYGITKVLSQAGASTIIIGKDKEALIQACSELGDNASYRVFDLSHREYIPKLIGNIFNEYGRIDILVNNAGLHLKKEIIETSDEELDVLINTNLLSTFSITRECINKMIKQRSGNIILISSMAALFGVEKVSAYGASKAALTGLMQNLVAEVSKYNIRINTIAPGWIETDMFNKAVENDPNRKSKIVQRIALHGFGTPEDIGNAALFLCSDASKYITGIVMAVDGGASINF